MEAVYFGSGYAPKGKGSGSGPWIGERASANCPCATDARAEILVDVVAGDSGADMENGIYEGASNQASVPSLKPSDFIAGFVKGKPGNHYRFVAGPVKHYTTWHA
jgi:hypothetical protein